MARQKPLPQRFPDAHTTFRLKLWRPLASMEADGPMDEATSNLMCLLAAYTHPKGKAKKIIEDAYEKLAGLNNRKSA